MLVLRSGRKSLAANTILQKMVRRRDANTCDRPQAGTSATFAAPSRASGADPTLMLSNVRLMLGPCLCYAAGLGPEGVGNGSQRQLCRVSQRTARAARPPHPAADVRQDRRVL